MSKVTIRTIKQALASAFPDIEFTYGQDGRRGCSGHGISWIGGPNAETVQRASGAPVFSYGHATTYHFVRKPTPEEWAEMTRKWDEDYAARVAAEPARRAAAKAAGIEKRREAAAQKKTHLATLAQAFPGVSFDISMSGGTARIDWQDGPDVEAVTSLVPVSPWQCTRKETPAAIAVKAEKTREAVQAGRIVRRLAAVKAKGLRIQAAQRRQRERAERIASPAQYCLPFMMAEVPVVSGAFQVRA